MEIYNPEYDFFPCINILGIGTTGANASDYFGKVADDIFPARLTISDKEADLRAKISDFIIDETLWLFVIADIGDLKLAKKVAECIEEAKKLPTAPSIEIPSFSAPPKLIYTEESQFPTISFNHADLISKEFKLPLVTFLVSCPSAEDVRLADIPENFGTWIILPKDKIAELALSPDEVILRAVNMATSIAPIMKKHDNIIGMDFVEIPRIIGNAGRACIGFGESLDAENPALAAVKKALKSPLFIEEIGKAKKVLLVFFGRTEFLSMLQMNEAASFLNELRQADGDDITLWQVDLDEPFDKDGVAAFILATDFEE